MKADLLGDIKKKSEATEEEQRLAMFDMLEINTVKFRSKMADYERHRASNLMQVNRLLRARNNQNNITSSDVSSQFR